ncbi:MAG: hypothetical protein LBD31_03395 [Treponema sp.]|jgi:hypothetical protein|nr:hypothetical protein [Treponema sp.]
MAGNKTVLIVTDEDGPIKTMAAAIAASLPEYTVITVEAGDFQGTHILPADICFFGAAAPDPPSFARLQRVLEHINLAGRPCGIFFTAAAAAGYLRRMVRDSELVLCGELGSGGEPARWAQQVARGGRGGGADIPGGNHDAEP